MTRLLRRLRMLIQRERAERSMDEEMRLHIELEAAERIREGLSPAQAHDAARRAFGGLEQQKELARDARGTRGIEDLLRDLRYAARTLGRAPTFTTAAVLTFALAIGAATAIFSIVYGVLLRPLPYRNPARLVAVWEHDTTRGNARNVVSLQNFEDWRARARSFEGMAAIVPAPVTLPGPDGPERVNGAEVTPRYFTMLGVQPALGRDFVSSDLADGGRVAILSDGYWRTRLGADRAILGRALLIGGEPFEVVGIMPPGFDPPAFGWLGAQALWMPLAPTSQKYSWGRFLLVVGRLRGGVTLDVARSEIASIAAAISEQRPANLGWSATIVPLAEQLSGHVRSSLGYVLGTMLLLLALAVTNVGALVLARTRRRLHELGVRRAIGASDGRIFRQLLTESLLLAAAGCLAGIAVAYPALRVLRSLLPADVPRQASIRVDAVVLATTAAVTLGAGLAFGVLAARRGRRAPSTLIRDGVSSRATARGGRSLVVAEVSIGVVVAVLAGLMMRSLIELRSVDLGFDPSHVVVGRVALGSYETEPARRAFLDQLLVALRDRGLADPGVVTARPLGGLGPASTFGRSDTPDPANGPVADVRWADDAFFRTLRIPFLAGEPFGALDGPGAAPRAVITDSMARALWPGASAIGRRLRVNVFGGLDVRVAGVIGDLHLFDPRTPPRPAVYLSAHQFTGEIFDIVVRSDRPASETVSRMRRTLAELNPRIPLHRVETMDGLVASTLAGDSFVALLLTGFGLLGLGLAAVGIYGVLAGDVAARTREIGVRMALGAAPDQVLAEVLGRALTSTLAGIAIGAAAAVLAGRAMTPLLFGVTPMDPISYLLPAALVVVLALGAALVPALRASRIAPILVLRGE